MLSMIRTIILLFIALPYNEDTKEIARFVSLKERNLYLSFNSTRFKEYYDYVDHIGVMSDGTVEQKGECYILKLNRKFWIGDKDNYDADLNEHKICLKDTINFMSTVYIRHKPVKQRKLWFIKKKRSYRP